MLNEDYKDMLQCLLEEKVRFLLVGAYAVAVYGYPRATKDIDVFVRAAPDNASNLMRALRRFGGVDFEEAYAHKEDVSIEGLQVPVISLEDLIANKRASGRTQDLADVEKLEALKQK